MRIPRNHPCFYHLLTLLTYALVSLGSFASLYYAEFIRSNVSLRKIHPLEGPLTLSGVEGSQERNGVVPPP